MQDNWKTNFNMLSLLLKSSYNKYGYFNISNQKHINYGLKDIKSHLEVSLFFLYLKTNNIINLQLLSRNSLCCWSLSIIHFLYLFIIYIIICRIYIF